MSDASLPDQPRPLSPAPLLAPAEREAAIERLSSAFAADVLTMDEFERRVTDAYRVASRAELAVLLADLPQESSATTPGTHGAQRMQRSAGLQGAQPRTRLSAFFSSLEQRMQSLPPGLEVRATFGNAELDLGDVQLPRASVTEIAVRAVFGNIELVLPADVVVENYGSGILGNFECQGGGQRAPDAPVVRIVGRAVLGNVEITVRRTALPDPTSS